MFFKTPKKRHLLIMKFFRAISTNITFTDITPGIKRNQTPIKAIDAVNLEIKTT